MSVHCGTDILNDGLILSYDLENIQKSWKGKPTINLISNPTEEMARGEFGQYRDLAPVFNTNGLVPYSLSMDIKVNKPGSVTVYMQNGSTTKYSFVNQSVNATTEYQRFYFNNITPTISNAADTAATLATYTGYGSGVTPTVKNIQLELGAFSTPFVNGTRFNTQSVIDLTGKNTITASSVTYNSNGTFSFATGNYLTCPFTKPASMTLSVWATTTVAPASQSSMLFNAGASGSGPDLYFSSGNIYWNIWDGAANPLGAIPATANNGSYHNYVLVNESGVNARLYYDGVLLGTATYRSPTANTNFAIGGGGAGDYSWVGNIGIFNVYNRALTTSEVLNNFNATKSRYGL